MDRKVTWEIVLPSTCTSAALKYPPHILHIYLHVDVYETY